jgi:thiol:disulfide interchange protein DsbC
MSPFDPMRSPFRFAAARSGLVLAAALFAIGCSPSSADAQADAKADKAATSAAPAAGADIRAQIAKKLDVPVEAVRDSVVPGLYEVVHQAEVLYATKDGKYVVAGDLYDLDSRTNLSEKQRSAARAAALRTIPDSDVVEFGPKDAKYTIDVFTDIDCGYCRKLHSEIAEYNKLGIRVRYMFFPRSGPGTESWQKAVSVACAPNKQDALTRAKAGEALPERNCKNAPVAKTYQLGRELQVKGTPGIFTEQGDYVPGYRPPQQMLAMLKELEGGTPVAAQ